MLDGAHLRQEEPQERRAGAAGPRSLLTEELKQQEAASTGMSGHVVGRIKGTKCPFDLQFLTWDFS